jgi:glycosyltransferase involved in cell wall biosynthesis
MADSSGSLLCVVNYPANTGFAWDFIEGLYGRIADHLATHGIPTFVAYPSIPKPPRTLEGSAARAIALDASLDTAASRRATVDLIRRENVRVVYYTDRGPWRWAYLRLRRAGVKRIIVHDHTSGERTRPRGLKRAAKWVLARTPGIVADTVIAVSDYVARRQLEVALIPPGKVIRIWNGVAVPEARDRSCQRIHAMFGLAPGRPLIACACRAAPEKGVAHLLRAFNRVVQSVPAAEPRPVLLYIGDGPQLAELKALRESLPARDDIILAGYRTDARAILEGADLCVVPSVWQDAFPLAVLEAMAWGKPVIATRVGGIPEMIEDRVHGLLVPPADEPALAEALQALLADPARAARMGEAARRRVAEQFTTEEQIRRQVAIVEEGLGRCCDVAPR